MVPGNAWDGNRLGQHHLATHLAERIPVLWVDQPISPLTQLNEASAAAALREERLCEVAPNILRLSPVAVPGASRPGMREGALRQARRSVRRAVARLGARVHSTLVDTDAAVSLLLVGPRSPTFAIAKLDALLARPNVRWVGRQPFAALPSYLRAVDIGLTPYAQSAFNEASFPLKTLEYRAAGRPAVVSDLPAHRWVGAPHGVIADTPASFAASTLDLLERPPSQSEAAARRAFGAANSWSARAGEVARLIGLEAAPEPARAA